MIMIRISGGSLRLRFVSCDLVLKLVGTGEKGVTERGSELGFVLVSEITSSPSWMPFRGPEFRLFVVS